MWEPFIVEKALPELPPKTRDLFLRFANTANKQALHPLDWGRFYKFTRFCHARRVNLPSQRLRELLEGSHFAVEKAEYLSDIYEHCRSILASKWIR